MRQGAGGAGGGAPRPDPGTLRVATFASVSIHWLPAIMKEFLGRYPGIQFDLVSNWEFAEVEDLLRQGQADCGFLGLPAGPGLETYPLFRDELMAVLPLDHPLAKAPYYPMERFREDPYINTPEERDLEIGLIFQEEGFRPNLRYTVNDDFAALAMVEQGLGVSIRPELVHRIAICLKGIAKAFKKVYILMSYPSDEVGNHLFDEDLLDEKGVNPWSDVLDEAKYRELFGYEKHPFTGVDYVEYYGDLFRAEGCEPVFLFGNDVRAVLPYTKNVLCCDIHTRERSRRRLLAAGAEKVLLLSDLMTAPVNGSGYNEQFGLLGSNKATEESVKLFPRDCRSFVDALAQSLRSATGRQIEVMVYGDGAFKDPVGKIWELADPVVSPAYTSGLEGQPNELKLKYLADNDFASLSGDALTSAIKDSISHKNADLKGLLLTHQRLAAGVDVQIDAQLLALGDDAVDLLKGQIELIAVLPRPAAGAVQVAGGGGVQQDGPGNIAVVLLAQFLLLGPAHQVCIDKEVVEYRLEHTGVGLGPDLLNELVPTGVFVVNYVIKCLPLEGQGVSPANLLTRSMTLPMLFIGSLSR